VRNGLTCFGINPNGKLSWWWQYFAAVITTGIRLFCPMHFLQKAVGKDAFFCHPTGWQVRIWLEILPRLTHNKVATYITVTHTSKWNVHNSDNTRTVQSSNRYGLTDIPSYPTERTHYGVNCADGLSNKKHPTSRDYTCVRAPLRFNSFSSGDWRRLRPIKPTHLREAEITGTCTGTGVWPQ
jgi:hypothetical protein